MSFVLTEEQIGIKKTARDFVRERLSVAGLRRLRDEGSEAGFDRAAWSELCELGLASVHLPESWGGSGLGYAELGLVQEELGANLAATPLLASSVFAAELLRVAEQSAEGEASSALAVAGSELSAGTSLWAVAHEERARFAPHHVRTRLEDGPRGLRLNGAKSLVLDGHVADQLLVVARSWGADDDPSGLSLVWLPADTPGVERTRLSTVDSRNHARFKLEDVAVAPEQLLLAPGEAGAVLDAALARVTIALCAEMLGAALAVFERTVQYLKERQQFGVPIGSFQALQHRAAQLFCELELSKSIVMQALRAIDAEQAAPAEARGEAAHQTQLLSSVAKARLSTAYLLAAAEGIQMHGGVGVTDELDVGLYYKRARVSELYFGDAAYHQARFATLSGF